MAKKNKKPTKAKYHEVLIQALIDFTIGLLLIIIDKSFD